jgi:hypothetical protein
VGYVAAGVTKNEPVRIPVEEIVQPAVLVKSCIGVFARVHEESAGLKPDPEINTV